MHITKGFAPLVHEAIPPDIEKVTRGCLTRNSAERFSAGQVTRKLYELAGSYCKDSPNASNGTAECICHSATVRNTMPEPRTNRFTKNMVLIVHEFVEVDSSFVSIRVQVYDNTLKILQEYHLPVADVHCNRYVRSSFIMVNNQIICQALQNAKTQLIVIAAFDFQSVTWHRLDTTIKVHPWRFAPVVVGSTIYYWDGNVIRAATVSGSAFVFEPGPGVKISVWEQPFSAGAAAHGNSIILFGGLPTTDDGFGMQEVERYDAVSGRHSFVAETGHVLGPRTDCAFSVVDGFLYVTGGHNLYQMCINSCLRLRGDSVNWERIAPLRQPRSMHGAFAIHKRFYIFGGYLFLGTPEESLSQTMEAYDPQTDTWTDYPFQNLDDTDFTSKRLSRTSCFVWISL